MYFIELINAVVGSGTVLKSLGYQHLLILLDKVINFEPVIFIAHCCLISVGSMFWVSVF